MQLSGGSLIFSEASPPNPPIVTTTTIPLQCDEMFEAIVPADVDDNDDRIVTTTSSLNAQLQQDEESVAQHAQEQMSAIPEMSSCMQMSNGHHHMHPAMQQQQLTRPPPLPPLRSTPPLPQFLPFSPEDSPTPLGPNLQNTAEINSPEQVPLPSSTVSALPIPDTISPDLLQLPAHCFQLWFSSTGSPCPDSTSNSGSLVPPLSPYLPALVAGPEHNVMSPPHCPSVYQELEP